MIDYENLDNLFTYRLTPKATNRLELNIKDFYESVDETKEITIGYLKYRKITVLDEDSEVVRTWPVFRCLFVEFLIGEENFIFFKGKWYVIDENYLASLRSFIQRYEVEVDFLTPWNGVDSEEDFNNQIAVELNGQCWDRKLYYTDLYSYGIEFCDVLSTDHIYHVKKYTGSQLTSHLLMQTTVSAQLMNSDKDIRNWINIKVEEDFGGDNLILNDDLTLRNNDIEYFILLMSQRDGLLSNILPFFTLITMHLTIKRIVQLGFSVRVGKI